MAQEAGRICPRCGFRNPEGGLYCSKCSAVLSEVEAFRLEKQRRREDEVLERVVRKIIELAPDVLERALRESGALAEMSEEESEPYLYCSPARIRTGVNGSRAR